jgi:hypothetical protein
MTELQSGDRTTGVQSVPMPNLNEEEIRALECLSNHYHSEGNCLYFRTIAEYAGIEPKRVRRIVRSLARKGYAEFVRGLFDDDGQAAGSGYCCTRAGYDRFQKIVEAEGAHQPNSVPTT